jgi:DNA polymerase III subunit delta'
MIPWQAEQRQWFLRLYQTNRLPHALLLTGLAGVGKTQFAQHAIRTLLCLQQTAADDCNCHACALINNSAHPNVLWIEPEKSGQAIKVEQIRVITDFIHQSSLEKGYRIVVIHPAHDMNLSAANALLKTLEEPAPESLIFLLSHQESLLPATILSRCQRLVFSKPKKELALSWLTQQINEKNIDCELLLNLAHGAPFAALQLAHDNLNHRKELFTVLINLQHKKINALAAANHIQEMETLLILDFLLSWFIDLLRLQFGNANVTNKDYENELLTLTQRTQPQNNIKMLEYIQLTCAHIKRGFNLNKQLLLEDIFLKWCAS